MATVFEEDPYDFAILSENHNLFCHHCCRKCRRDQLMRCSKCKFAHYCEKKCQIDAWKDHSKECKCLRTIHPEVPMAMTRLIARIWWKIEEDPSQMKPNEEDEPRTIANLVSHASEIAKEPASKDVFDALQEQLTRFLGRRKFPSDDILLELFGKVYINTFTLIGGDLGRPFGVGLYLELSRIDHSCDPNSVVVWRGKRAVLNVIKNSDGVSSKDVLDFKKISVCYIDSTMPTAFRRANLEERYFFRCHCSMCLDEIQDRMRYSILCPDSKCDGAVLFAEEADIGNCAKCNRVVNDVRPAVELINTLILAQRVIRSKGRKDIPLVYARVKPLISEAERILHPYNRFYNNLLKIAIEISIFCGDDISEGLGLMRRYHQPFVRGLRSLYPSGTPELTYDLLRLAVGFEVCDSIEENKLYLTQALEEAKISHGLDHELLTFIAGELKRIDGK